MSKDGRGWRNEPGRHSLAAKGIRTAFGKSKVRQFRQDKSVPPKELVNINWGKVGDIAHKEPTSRAIKLFWWCSIHDTWEWFNFEEFFERTKFRLDTWMKRHFWGYFDELNDDYNNWRQVWQKGSKDSMGRIRDLMRLYPVRAPELLDSFSNLTRKVNKNDAMNVEEKVKLVDEIIHFEHMNNNLFMLNISKLREDFEEEYL